MSKWRADNPVNQYICARMRKRRAEQNISRTELAQEIGVSYQQLQKYETGKNTPSAAKLWLIAEHLDVPVTYFYPPKGVLD